MFPRWCWRVSWENHFSSTSATLISRWWRYSRDFPRGSNPVIFHSSSILAFIIHYPGYLPASSTASLVTGSRRRSISSSAATSDSRDICGRISPRTGSGRSWRTASSPWTSCWSRQTPPSCTPTPGPASCPNISRTASQRSLSPSSKDTVPSR